MLKLTSTLFAILIFSGCAERGYHLSRQASTHTLTAQSSVNISNTHMDTRKELHKMELALKKERKKYQEPKAVDTITEINARKDRLKALKAQQDAAYKEQKRQAEARRKREKMLKAKNLKRAKEAQEKARQEKIREEAQRKRLQEEKRKKLQMLKANNEAQKAKALEAQMAKEKQMQEAKKAKALQQAKQKQAAQKALALKEAEKERKLQAQERAILEEEKKSKIKRLQAQREQEIQLNKMKKSKAIASTTEPLKFQLINKIYHKFGTSEIHGHVIYLNTSGQEIRLTGAKVYLLPVSAKLNNWFTNYYLKNKSNPNSNGTVANYLNSTYLNLEKNFEFYGVAEGSYYVIIEAKYPTYMARDKKVYIAKKIQVGKYKKIMAVFSKKL